MNDNETEVLGLYLIESERRGGRIIIQTFFLKELKPESIWKSTCHPMHLATEVGPDFHCLWGLCSVTGCDEFTAWGIPLTCIYGYMCLYVCLWPHLTKNKSYTPERFYYFFSSCMSVFYLSVLVCVCRPFGDCWRTRKVSSGHLKPCFEVFSTSQISRKLTDWVITHSFGSKKEPGSLVSFHFWSIWL